jgi:hypothetical protein
MPQARRQARRVPRVCRGLCTPRHRDRASVGLSRPRAVLSLAGPPRRFARHDAQVSGYPQVAGRASAVDSAETESRHRGHLARVDSASPSVSAGACGRKSRERDFRRRSSRLPNQERPLISHSPISGVLAKPAYSGTPDYPLAFFGKRMNCGGIGLDSGYLQRLFPFLLLLPADRFQALCHKLNRTEGQLRLWKRRAGPNIEVLFALPRKQIRHLRDVTLHCHAQDD